MLNQDVVVIDVPCRLAKSAEDRSVCWDALSAWYERLAARTDCTMCREWQGRARSLKVRWVDD